MVTRGSALEIIPCKAFHHLPRPEARVLIVGLTPGRQKHELALQVMAEGGGCDELERRVAFAGSMRTNLVNMLDELGLHTFLGLPTYADAFGTTLLATTSAVRDPVFVNGRNWTGSNPGILQNERTRCYVETHLCAELLAVPDAQVIPLGLAVSSATTHLGDSIGLDRVLVGFPHPSGANGRCARLFLAARDEMKDAVTAWSKGEGGS